MVKRVADLLKLFGEADGFKFLTHDFDPTRNDDFISLVNRYRILLVENACLIPSHLYDLLFGFLYGKTWEDSDGKKICSIAVPMSVFSGVLAILASIR